MFSRNQMGVVAQAAAGGGREGAGFTNSGEAHSRGAHLLSVLLLWGPRFQNETLGGKSPQSQGTGRTVKSLRGLPQGTRRLPNAPVSPPSSSGDVGNNQPTLKHHFLPSGNPVGFRQGLGTHPDLTKIANKTKFVFMMLTLLS